MYSNSKDPELFFLFLIKILRPIFWKDKPLVTQQIRSWNKNLLKDLIYKTNEIELLVKKNSVLAKNILADFIINNSKKTNN